MTYRTISKERGLHIPNYVKLEDKSTKQKVRLYKGRTFHSIKIKGTYNIQVTATRDLENTPSIPCIST